MWTQLFFAGQQRHTGRNLREVRARQELRRAQVEIEELEVRFRKLSRLTKGMWEILKVELDLEDGLLEQIVNHQDDAKKESTVSCEEKSLKCPNCHRSFSMKTGNCVYCGTPVLQRNLF